MTWKASARHWTWTLDAEFGHRDITPDLAGAVAEAGVRIGVVTVQLTGSTGAVATIEYESGALQDLRRALDRIAAANGDYAHNARWGDGNGFSHLRSALLKTGLTIPVVEGRLALGTWQQVVVINLDNRRRAREVVAVVMGE